MDRVSPNGLLSIRLSRGRVQAQADIEDEEENMAALLVAIRGRDHACPSLRLMQAVDTRVLR